MPEKIVTIKTTNIGELLRNTIGAVDVSEDNRGNARLMTSRGKVLWAYTQGAGSKQQAGQIGNPMHNVYFTKAEVSYNQQVPLSQSTPQAERSTDPETDYVQRVVVCNTSGYDVDSVVAWDNATAIFPVAQADLRTIMKECISRCIRYNETDNGPLQNVRVGKYTQIQLPNGAYGNGGPPLSSGYYFDVDYRIYFNAHVAVRRTSVGGPLSKGANYDFKSRWKSEAFVVYTPIVKKSVRLRLNVHQYWLRDYSDDIAKTLTPTTSLVLDVYEAQNPPNQYGDIYDVTLLGTYLVDNTLSTKWADGTDRVADIDITLKGKPTKVLLCIPRVKFSIHSPTLYANAAHYEQRTGTDDGTFFLMQVLGGPTGSVSGVSPLSTDISASYSVEVISVLPSPNALD